MNTYEKLKSTFVWGFILWLVGYLAGVALFFVIPKDYIGWVITPLAVLLTVWVLIKKIKRPEYKCYFGLGLIWTAMAVVLDFIFMVLLLNTGKSYYKPDVFIYYILTFSLPLIVGYWKYKHKPAGDKLF
jgi:hypothetical protein